MGRGLLWPTAVQGSLVVNPFPSMKAKRLLALLERQPLRKILVKDVGLDEKDARKLL
jgi:hypothetical protein